MAYVPGWRMWPVTGVVSLYGDTHSLSQAGIERWTSASLPRVEVAEAEEMLTLRVACSVFRLGGLSRQVSVR